MPSGSESSTMVSVWSELLNKTSIFGFIDEYSWVSVLPEGFPKADLGILRLFDHFVFPFIRTLNLGLVDQILDVRQSDQTDFWCRNVLKMKR